MEELLNSLAQSGQLTFPLVFLAGILSFFSPCVLPVLPLYMGYLSKGAQEHIRKAKVSKANTDPGASHFENTASESAAPASSDASEQVFFSRSKVMVHTIFFVLGISAAFFLAGLVFTALGQALSQWRPFILRAGGILLIIFGAWMILAEFMPKLMGSGREYRFKMPAFKNVNPGIAFLLGFIFSFAWTPCVGPILSSILLLVSTSSQLGYALALIAVYSLGFIVPFLILGLFTTQILNALRRHRSVLKYTAIAGGVLVMLMGALMTFGLIGSINSYLARFSSPSAQSQSASSEKSAENSSNSSENSASSDKQSSATSSTSEDKKDSTSQTEEKKSSAEDDQKHPVAFDFELTDQNGKVHKLSDYKGKTIFLNFWATWCGPCRHEIPDIQKLYENHGQNSKDVIVIGVSNPSNGGRQMIDAPLDEVKAFIKENNMSYPVLFDLDGSVYNKYNVNAFPTTYIIRPDGRISGYIPGAVPGTVMERVVNEAKNAQ